MVLNLKRTKNKLIVSILFTLVLVTVFFRQKITINQHLCEYDGMIFDQFNNETGVDYFVVPNIIHQVRFNQKNFTFVDYVCVMSAFRNQRPDLFYIHTNIPDGQFEGKYWQWIQQNEQIHSRVRVVYVELPTEIFGQSFDMDEYGLWHASDVVRLRVLMEYGGIYMDNDVYIIQNLDKYRKFEATINWDEGKSLCNHFIVANRNARFLPLWISSYEDYRPDLWYKCQ